MYFNIWDTKSEISNVFLLENTKIQNLLNKNHFQYLILENTTSQLKNSIAAMIFHKLVINHFFIFLIDNQENHHRTPFSNTLQNLPLMSKQQPHLNILLKRLPHRSRKRRIHSNTLKIAGT